MYAETKVQIHFEVTRTLFTAEDFIQFLCQGITIYKW